MKNLLAFVSKTLGTRMVSRVNQKIIGTVVGFDKHQKTVLLCLEPKEGSTYGWFPSMIDGDDIILCSINSSDKLCPVDWEHLIDAPVDLYDKYGVQKGDIVYSQSEDAVGRLILIRSEDSALFEFDNTLECNHCTGWRMSETDADACGIEYDKDSKLRYLYINPKTMYKI